MLDIHGLNQRARFLQAVRTFFCERGYLEVDTPVRLPVLIPEANIFPFGSEDGFLQTSPEMCMKILMANGCSKLFQICHCFRKEEIGRFHLPEFCMLEWYHGGWDYQNLMEECEAFIRFVAGRMAVEQVLFGSGDQLFVRGRQVTLHEPWDRVTVAEAFDQYADVDVMQALQEDTFDRVLVEKIEPQLGIDRPVFLYDYPVQLASLARAKQDAPSVAERFELYIAGIEIANGFSELCDPAMMRNRFIEELGKMHPDKQQRDVPETFLAWLCRYPESAGIALGLDRLLMLMVGADSIQSVVPLNWEDLQE
ncbi:EF-P lysine aminoacylase EpmA [Desulfogranum japonicum]|uniref:EF-P lysine aminoacylase EpmA n=1 Tax=Desulfogranum japonicum TaxID=231447 RepID=UPI000414C8DC|nr:EF-P lysine aminoacylase EpmA [Desulfogranum japonicum]